MALPFLLRKALLLLNVLEVEDTPQHFGTRLKAGGLMDVVERYPWTGEAVLHPRRDKRRGEGVVGRRCASSPLLRPPTLFPPPPPPAGAGMHSAHVERAEDGSPRIVCTWTDPLGGVCTDTFVLSSDGTTLTQVTYMRMSGSGRSTEYR